MTDKLPDFVEAWIAENADEAYFGIDAVQSVRESDLRAFLAQYVLCDKEPIAFSHDRQADVVCSATQKARYPNTFQSFTDPLHAPATKEPIATPEQ